MQQMWAATSCAYDFLSHPPNQSVLKKAGDFSARVPRRAHSSLVHIASVTSQSLCQAVEATGALSSHS